jgi:hypothetical protein
LEEGIDVVHLTKSLSQRPRGRACIAFTHNYLDQKTWAAELAKRAGAGHLHLLDTFADDERFSENVGAFSVDDLFRFFTENINDPILIVSGLEFLKATWLGQASVLEQFARQVEMWDKKPALLFVMQYDRFLASLKFERFKQYPFVIDQRDTLALT